MRNYPVGSYDRDPNDAYRPVDLDHLENEGPRRWGYMPGGALQQRFFFGIGAVVIRAVLGPYVLVRRSRLPRWGKVAAFAVLAVAYALAFAALTLIPPPPPR